MYLELVFSVAEDANKIRQVHLTFEVVGPACQNIAGNITLTDKRKSLLVIQIQQALWRNLNNLKPIFGLNKDPEVFIRGPILPTRN